MLSSQSAELRLSSTSYTKLIVNPLWMAARMSSVKASASLNVTSTRPSRGSGVTWSVCAAATDAVRAPARRRIGESPAHHPFDF